MSLPGQLPPKRMCAATLYGVGVCINRINRPGTVGCFAFHGLLFGGPGLALNLRGRAWRFWQSILAEHSPT
jgi:hypothetical protein